MGNVQGAARQDAGLAILYARMGDFRKAMRLFKHSLEVFEEALNQSDTAASHNAISIVHHRQGNHKLAIESAEKSLKLFKQIGNRQGMAAAQGNLAIAHLALDNDAKALKYFKESRDGYKAVNDEAGVARQEANIGTTFHKQEKFKKAEEHYEAANRLFKKRKNVEWMSMTDMNMAEIHLLSNRPEDCIQRSLRGLELAQSTSNDRIIWELEFRLGKAYEQVGKIRDAEHSYKRSIKTLSNSVLALAGGEESQVKFMEDKTGPFNRLVQLLAKQKRIEEALKFAERSKARILGDAVKKSRTNPLASLSSAKKEEFAIRRELLNNLNSQMLRANVELAGGKIQKLPAELVKRHEKARAEYQSFVSDVYTENAVLARRKASLGDFRLADAQPLLRDSKTVLLNFLCTKDQLIIFSIKRSGSGPVLNCAECKITRESLNSKVRLLRKSITSNDPAVRKQFFAHSRELHRLILEPLKDQLQGTTHWIISADGPLWELPFAALLGADNKYLIENVSLAYTPSFSVLREVYKREGTGKQATATTALLAMGNPTNESVAKAGAELVAAKRFVVGDLLEAETEVNEIIELHKQGGETRFFLRKNASEKRFKELAGDSRVIHLATHGVLENVNPMYSFVLLANDENEDGLLEAWELMNVKTKAELAVLSACESAGASRSGEGLIGLTWALFVAGCPSTLSSQWRVDDHATKTLMIKFHEKLNKKGAIRNKANALQAAQQAMINQYDPKTRKLRGIGVAAESQALPKGQQPLHPFYWAGFVLVGDAR